MFEQYLTTTKVPLFEYRIEGSTLSYHWADVVAGFDMPVKVWLGEEGRKQKREGRKAGQEQTLSLIHI